MTSPTHKIDDFHDSGFGRLKKPVLLNSDVQVSGRRAGVRRTLSEVYLLVNLFLFKVICYLYFSVDCFHIWYDEEEDQQACCMQGRQLSLCSLCTYVP